MQASLQSAVHSLHKQLQQHRQDEEAQKQRCFEVLKARDKKYQTDTHRLQSRLDHCAAELVQQKQLVEVLQSR